MVFGSAFSDVMQQQRDVNDPPIDAPVQNARGDGQVFDQFAFFDLGQLGHALNDMFVDRVGMIHIELHHRHDRFKLGDKGGQESQFVHPPQGPFWVAVFQQKIQENAFGFRIFSDRVINPLQVCGHQPHRVGMQQHAGAQPFLEQAQQVQGILQEGVRVRHGQAIVNDVIAGFDLWLAPENAL